MNKISLEKATDGELLARFEAGRDCRALEELIHRYGAMVRATARRSVAQDAEVDDAFQATFFALAKQACKLKRKAVVAGWLQKTARNTAVNIVREQARWQRGAAHMTENYEQRRDESHDCTDPSTKAANAELKQVLDEEVARLSEPLRDAVVLCDLQGKTQKAAAKLLGISVSAVNERVAKARRLLRKRLIHRGVTLTVAGLATCIANSVENVSASVAPTVAKNATLYAGGKSASEIGVASIVTQSANKVILAMTKAKLLTVALLSTTIVLFAGSMNGLIGNREETARAGTIFFDDFSDGDYSDGNPVTWEFSPLNAGDVAVQEGRLILSPNDQTLFDGSIIGLGVNEAISDDMSIRAQLRVGRDGDTAIITNNQIGFVAAVGYESNLGGSYVALGKVAGGTLATTQFLPSLSGIVTPLLAFDLRDEDATVQLDIIENEITLWVWPEGSDRPEDPLFRVDDDSIGGFSFPMIGAFIDKPHKGLENSGVSYRYVHVASSSIPEPSAGSLAMLGTSVLFGIMARRSRVD